MSILPIPAASSSLGQTSPVTSQVAAGTAATTGAQDTASTAPTTATGSAPQTVDAATLAGAIDKVQDFTNTLANELKFSIDDKSGQTVVKIVDTATDEVIRQIPSEEMLAIADALGQIQGVLLKQKA